jgi:hypothetical protein
LYFSISFITVDAVKCRYSVLGNCSSYPVVVTLEEKRMANDEPFQNPIPETPSSWPVTDWKPYRLPELASNGLPFSPTFILPRGDNSLDATATHTESARPFGFHYWRRHALSNRPVIDLTRGYYDPYTQVYTIPLQAGGDTDGGTIPTGSWTEKGDGTTPTKEWDITDDRVTD